MACFGNYASVGAVKIHVTTLIRTVKSALVMLRDNFKLVSSFIMGQGLCDDCHMQRTQTHLSDGYWAVTPFLDLILDDDAFFH